MSSANKMLKIEDLVQSHIFRLPKQRKFRVFRERIELEAAFAAPEDFGKWLVIYDGCNQMVLPKETEVIVYVPYEESK